MISVILPAYNEEGNIERAYLAISEILNAEKEEYEILFIDDGSHDKTWEKIECLNSKYNNAKGITFSRNFGKEAAVFAGLEYSKGDCCIVLDCDLQHPPKIISDMLKLWREGYEVIDGVKKDRGAESKVHKFAANAFYKIISKIIRMDMANASDFKLLDRKVVNTLLQMMERTPFFRGLVTWVGYKKAKVEFEVEEREVGESKWSVISLIKYAISNITSFSTAPMQIITCFGVIGLVVCVFLVVYYLILWFNGYAIDDISKLVLLLIVLSSIIMFGIGILGFYLAKIYEEVRQRPRYIVSKKL